MAGWARDLQPVVDFGRVGRHDVDVLTCRSPALKDLLQHELGRAWSGRMLSHMQVGTHRVTVCAKREPVSVDAIDGGLTSSGGSLTLEPIICPPEVSDVLQL
jgi:hypothetical protein